jgi:molybdopterin synthase sulfur carrier subunit
VTATVRVVLPAPLRTLAALPADVPVPVDGPVTLGAVLDALEACHPVLQGTIRDRATGRRRPFVRFFACEEDLSHEPPSAVLPDAVATGSEPLVVLGAMAGG